MPLLFFLWLRTLETGMCVSATLVRKIPQNPATAHLAVQLVGGSLARSIYIAGKVSF